VFGQTLGLINGLCAGLLFGAVSVLLFGLANPVKTDTTLAEVVNQLWRHVWQRGVRSELRSVFLVWFGIWWLALFIQAGGLVSSLYRGLLAAVVTRLMMGIVCGLSSDMLDEHTLVKPNQ